MRTDDKEDSGRRPPQLDNSRVKNSYAAVYGELRRIAHRQLARRRPDQTLNTTALVHEAYLKLGTLSTDAWCERSHFFAIAAQAMRFILIDYIRRRKAEKRGGDRFPVTLGDTAIMTESTAEKLLMLDEALRTLGGKRERLVRIVECRLFAGLTEQETAKALGLSVRTVRRDWLAARTWLRSQVG